MKCDTTEIRVEAVMNGLGIAYVMKEAVKKQLENGELYEVELPIELPELSINLVYIKDMLTQVDKKFIKKYLKNKQYTNISEQVEYPNNKGYSFFVR